MISNTLLQNLEI